MKKVAFIDSTSLLYHCYKNIRLIDIYDIVNSIARQEASDDCELEIRIIFDCHREAFQPLMQSLVSLRKKYEEGKAKEKATITLINGYNAEEEKNLSDLVILNSLYQDCIENFAEPNQYICVTAGTRFFSALVYLQEQTSNPVTVYVPEDSPVIPNIKDVFNVKTLPLAANKKTVLDKMVIKQIFKIIFWSEENGWLAAQKTIVDNCVELANMKRFDVTFMLHCLLVNNILEYVMRETPEGEAYRAMNIKDRDAVKKLIEDNGISL